MTENKGYLHIYTGNGKGKSTAAIGLALRAIGWDKKACVFQFFKHGPNGESKAAAFLEKKLKVVTFAETHPMFAAASEKQNAVKEVKKVIAEDLRTVKRVLRKGVYDTVVLDEIVNVINGRFITKRAALSLLSAKKASCELILTGRGAPKWLIAKADYVTHMQLIKHPYYKGIAARKSIEY